MKRPIRFFPMLVLVLFVLVNSWGNVVTSAQENVDEQLRERLNSFLAEAEREGENTPGEVLFAIAELSVYFGDYTTALTYVDRTIEKEPMMALPYVLKGEIELEFSDYEEAYAAFYRYWEGTYGRAIRGTLHDDLMEPLVRTMFYLGNLRGYMLEGEPSVGSEIDARGWFHNIILLMYDGYVSFEKYPFIISDMYITLADLAQDNGNLLEAQEYIRTLKDLWENHPEYDHTEHLSLFDQVTADISRQKGKKELLDGLLNIFK